MTPTEIAKIYMMSFYGEKPLNDMRAVVAEDLKFSGPFYKYDTADEYIESLEENLLGFGNYEILREIENETSCCLVYKFTKPGSNEEIMAQLFEVEGDKIIKIRLILNASSLLAQQ